MKLQSLASQAAFEKYARKSRRRLFLDEMENVVPWSGLEALVLPDLLHGEERKVWGDAGCQPRH